MADEQLLTKQLIIEGLTVVGATKNVRFNLQRGKVARIWGFNFNVSGLSSGQREYSCFVRKSPNANRSLTPRDLLWSAIIGNIVITTGIGFVSENKIMFPKPHRTTGITVQMHTTIDGSTRGVLIIYYDIADMIKGEATQALEKSVLKGRTRRTFAP